MSGQPPVQRRNGGRLLAHIAVVIGIAAVAAAAFALSYNAVRDIALAAGVPATLARLYPAIFDAVFVVACAAALTLREARWWARGYGWLSVLVTGALIGAAAVYHAMGLHLPHKIAAGIVAALPLALVVLGFSLWLSMLRHGRAERTAAADRPALGQAGPSQTLANEAGRAVTAEPVSGPAPAGDAAAEPARTEPAPDALTPPYGFPVVAAPSPAEDTSGAPAPEPERTTETGESQVLADTMAEPPAAPRTAAPTFLSAPVPEPAEPTPAPPANGGAPSPAAPQTPGAAATARGRPPTAGTDLPAGLAHEAAPAVGRRDPATRRASASTPGSGGQAGTETETEPGAAGEPPAAAAPPVRFERVRSTPTPPGD